MVRHGGDCRTRHANVLPGSSEETRRLGRTGAGISRRSHRATRRSQRRRRIARHQDRAEQRCEERSRDPWRHHVQHRRGRRGRSRKRHPRRAGLQAESPLNACPVTHAEFEGFAPDLHWSPDSHAARRHGTIEQSRALALSLPMRQKLKQFGPSCAPSSFLRSQALNDSRIMHDASDARARSRG